jgi:hypothetical protein
VLDVAELVAASLSESMNPIKRIDPRRPFIITAAGLKRITLGEEGSADASAAQWSAHRSWRGAPRSRARGAGPST